MLEYHPFALKFPDITGGHWDSFKGGILKSGGIKDDPVTFRIVGKERQGLDGRNRERACEEQGLQCTYKEVHVKDEDVKEYVLKKNMHRRHLSPNERRDLIAELKADGHSNRKIADIVGLDEKTVRSDVASGAENSAPETNGAQQITSTQPVENGKVTGKDGKQYSSKSTVFCKRCKRVGAVDGCEGCAEARKRSAQPKREREAGSTEPRRKKPSSGHRVMDYREIDKHFGAIVRQISSAEKASPKGDPLVKRMRESLNDFLEALEEFKKR